MVEAQGARKQAQGLALMRWMQQREQTCDARHKDDKLLGAGIMNMITNTMQGVAQGLEGGEEEK